MNSLYTSSWAKNVKPNANALWNEQFKELVNEGTRGRAAHPAYAKLMGMKSVQELKGKFTPRYFVTKVLKQIEKEHPNEKIEDVIASITDEDITNMMNLAAQMSRKLETKPELKFGAEKAEKKAPVAQRFQKGKDQIDTLQKNIEPNAHFSYEGDVGNNTVYSTKHNGLKYRVTVKNGSGKDMSLGDILRANVISLQVEDPSSETTVEGPQTDPNWETKLGSHKRHKLVADYPHGYKEGEDWNEPDPEELGGINAKRENEEEDAEESMVKLEIDNSVFPYSIHDIANMAKKHGLHLEYLSDSCDLAASDLNCYYKVGISGDSQKVQALVNQLMAEEGIEEANEEDINNVPPDGKAMKFPGSGNEEDNEEPVTKLSSQAQQREMFNQMMYKRRRMIEIQRRNDLGY